MSELDLSTLSFVSREVQDNPLAFCPPGAHGEIRLLAENGEPGEDVEETMVCAKKQTNHVLQVSGESLGYIYTCVEAQGNAVCRTGSRLISRAEWAAMGKLPPKMSCQKALCLTHRSNHGSLFRQGSYLWWQCPGDERLFTRTEA